MEALQPRSPQMLRASGLWRRHSPDGQERLCLGHIGLWERHSPDVCKRLGYGAAIAQMTPRSHIGTILASETCLLNLGSIGATPTWTSLGPLFGVILGPSLAILGPLGAILGPLGAILGPFGPIQ